MVDKVKRARRITGIAVGVVRGIFRSGRAWGSAVTRVKVARRPTPRAGGPGVVAGVAAGAAGAYFLDPHSGKRRRRVAFDRAKSLARSNGGEAEPAPTNGQRTPVRAGEG